MFSKQDILTANDRKVEAIQVPEWGGEVFIKVMSGTQRQKYFDRWNALRKELKTEEDFYVRQTELKCLLIAMSVVDAQGNSVFSDADVPLLMERSIRVIDFVHNECSILNGMSIRLQEETVKN